MSKADPLRAIEMVAEGVVVIALLAELVLVLANIFDRAYFRKGREVRIPVAIRCKADLEQTTLDK